MACNPTARDDKWILVEEGVLLVCAGGDGLNAPGRAVVTLAAVTVAVGGAQLLLRMWSLFIMDKL